MKNYIPSIVTSSLLGLTSSISKNPLDLFTVTSILSPVIEKLFTHIFSDVINTRNFSTIECKRVGVSFKLATEIINEKLKAGDHLREKSFFDGNEFSAASQLLEATIKSIINDSELKKVTCYSRFIANIPFDDECDVETLIVINSILSQLSYQELCIVRLMYDMKNFNGSIFDNIIRTNSSLAVSVFANQLVHLKSIGLLITKGPFSLSSYIGNLVLSPLGKQLYDMLELNLIDDSELASFRKIIETANK